MKYLSFLLRAFTLGSLVFATSCSGSGGGSDTETGTAALLLSSTGDTGVFALEADLTSVRLIREDGSSTGNVLPATMEVEMAGLGQVADWVADLEAEVGQYTGITLQFDPDSVEGMGMNGAGMDIDVPSGRCEIDLNQPLDVTPDASDPLEVVVDLEDSLRPQGQAWVFEPRGDAFLLDDDAGDRDLDQLVGLVVSASVPNGTLQIEVYHDDDMTQPMGFVRIKVDGDTMLFDDNGLEFPGALALFGSLRLGFTVVEVEGALQPNGTLLASKLEIIDQGGGTGRPPVVQIEGMVLYIADDNPPFQGGEKIVLLIREIEEGADRAKPVLESIGSPSSIDVRYLPETRFLDPYGTGIAPDELRVGQIVDVTFEDFELPQPFIATKIEFESLNVRFTGFIEEIFLDTNEVSLRLDDDDYDMHEDDLDDDDYEYASHDSQVIRVDLTDADITLDVRNDPEIEIGQLGVGMKLKVYGSLENKDDDMDGEPDRPFIDAESASLRPGRLEGDVTDADSGTGTAEVDDYEVKKTFGDGLGSGALQVVFDDDVYFFGRIKSVEEFYAAFEDAESSESLELRVEGVVGAHPNEVIAYEAKAKFRGGNGHGNGHDDDDDDDDDDDEEDDD